MLQSNTVLSKVMVLATILSMGIMHSVQATTVQLATNSQQRNLSSRIATEIYIAQAQPQNRRRIAVLDFDFASTGLTSSVLNWYGSRGPSQGVSDMLTNKLVQDGNYIVVERSRIQAVLAEQNLGQSGRVDASTAAQIGRILGVDAVVIGSITRFNLQEGRSGTSVLGVSVGGRRGTAEVQLTARLVSTNTAEILAVAQGAGTGEQGGNSVSVLGVFSNSSDTTGSDQILSQAAETAVIQLADQLNAQASKLAALPPTTPNVAALVADVAGNVVTLNRGARDGFQEGMLLSIERVTREVKDPATGQVIRTITSPVGRIRLTDVDDRSSLGTIVQGSGFRVGDRAVAAQ